MQKNKPEVVTIIDVGKSLKNKDLKHIKKTIFKNITNSDRINK